MVNKKSAKIVALLLIVSLFHYDYVCWAAPGSTSVRTHKKASSEDLREGASAKVYIIEDAHCLPSAQKEIAGILGNLYENDGVQSIYIEGCSGEQDFDYLRSYPLKTHKTKLLDEYLDEGKISGVEYFSALLPESLPLKVHGIEEKKNYQDNIDALCRVTRQRSVASKLEILKTYFQAELEPKISFIRGYDPYDPATMLRVISEGSVSISSRLQHKYPVIWQYTDGVEHLSDISLSQVLLEGKKFVGHYPSQNIKQRVTDLLIDPYTSCSIDQSIIDKIGDSSDYTHLKHYLLTLNDVSNFNPDDISENLSHFLEEYAYSYCDSDYTLQLVKAYFFCLRFEKLAALEFSEKQLSVCHQTVVPALPSSLPSDMRETFSQITTMYSGLLDDAVSFYEAARNRNSYMYDNFLEQFTAANESCAIVIGGFHSKDLQQLLVSHKMTFEVIRPSTIVGSGIDKNIYFQHFVSHIPQTAHSMPNNSSLAPAPILSLSNDFMYVDAPSHNWFNMFFDQLIEPLKKMPSLAVGWMKSISGQLIRHSGKTVRGLFLLTMISTAVASIGSNALGSEEAMPGNRMEQFYLAPGQTEEGTESIEELLIENRFKYHSDYKDAKELTKYLDSNIMHLQDAAIQLLEERHDVAAMLDYIETWGVSQCKTSIYRIVAGRKELCRPFSNRCDARYENSW